MKSFAILLSAATIILFAANRASTVPAQLRSPTDDEPISERLIALEKQVEHLTRHIQDVQLESRLTGHWVEKSWIRRGERIDESESVFGGGGGGSGGPVEWRLATDVASQRWVMAPEPVCVAFGKFTVDTTRSPAWIDFQISRGGKDYVIPGIVTCTYKQAKIAIPTDVFSDDGSHTPTRPASFESTQRNGCSVYTLVRESFDRSGVF